MSNVLRPRVTVITPAYNVEPYIGEAIDSVTTQTFRDFEYLVVDDGSTDGTVNEIYARIQADSRVRLLELDHAGASNARNAGISQARGSFIAFLDGDDRWHANFLESQLTLVDSLENSVAAVFGRSRVMSDGGRVYAVRWQRVGRYDIDDMLVQSCPPRVGSSLLIKKAAFDAAGLFDSELKSAQDLEMWLRIQRDSGMPYFWGNGTYLIDIRVRPGAISRDYEKRFESLDKLINEYAPQLRRHPRGMAYVRAAVFAYRAGVDEFALRWTQLAMEAGINKLLADSYGRRLLAWNALGPAQRRMLRGSSTLARSLIGRVLETSIVR
jgi:glycosyltransferase involved in cell wall biosynthesis